MRNILLTACLMLGCLFTIPAAAQRVVTGNVYDDANEPMMGVSVVVKEKRSIGTVTDSQGLYSLALPDDAKDYTIEVSYLGYAVQERKISTARTSKVDFRLREETQNLGMVVVTGTRTPKLLKNSPIITKVITENELKKIDVSNIGELLQTQLPGIEMSFSMDQQVSIKMQGFGGNAVLFLVDGERVAGETLDNIDYSRLNLDNVERIEIIKGAASSLYGSNAVGGVVNIISKVPDKSWAANVNTRFATHNQQRHGGTVSFNNMHFSNMLNVQHSSSDAIELDNPGAYSQVYGNRSWNIKERLRYTLNDRLALTGRLGYFFRERDAQVTKKDRYRGFTGGLKGEYAINDNNHIELSYAFDQYDKSDYAVVDERDTRDYSNVQHIGRALYNYSFGEKNNLTVGGDLMRDYLMSYQFENNGSYRQYVADVFGQLDWTPVEKLNVIAGLRYDYFSDNNINRVSPKVGLMYKPDNHFTIRGSYAAGFRAPTLKEKYMNFYMGNIFMIYGNPDLKPESSNNFSLSGEYTKSYFNFTLTGYYNLVENRITTAWSQARNGRVYSNIHKLNIVAADATASARFPCGISANLAYTYTHEYVDKGQVLVSESRPHTATARIEYDKAWKNYGFNVSLSGRYLSKVDTYEFATTTSNEDVTAVTYPGYSIWKLSLQQNIWKGISVIIGVDNLFNYVPDYYYSNSPYTTGTELSVGVSLDIDKLF